MGRPTIQDSNPLYQEFKERADFLKKQRAMSEVLHRKRVVQLVRDMLLNGMSNYAVAQVTGVTQHKYLTRLIEEATKGGEQ